MTSNIAKALLEIRTFSPEEKNDDGIDFEAVIKELWLAIGNTQITDIRSNNVINEDRAAELGFVTGNIKRVRASSEISSCKWLPLVLFISFEMLKKYLISFYWKARVFRNNGGVDRLDRRSLHPRHLLCYFASEKQ